MCTPIVIDDPQIDLSKNPLAVPSTPAGTGVTAPKPNGTGLTANSTDADGSTSRVAEPGAGSGDPSPRVVIDPVAAGPGGGINQTPTTATPIGDAGTKVPGAQPAGSTPQTSGTDPMNPATDPVLDQNTLLINSLTDLAHKFTDTTTGIIQAQTDAANAMKGGFLDLNAQQQAAMDAADQLRKNTGQASRKPSYSLSLDANRRSNSTGNSSTMLTGAGGVPTNTLALGRAQLLGGAAA